MAYIHGRQSQATKRAVAEAEAQMFLSKADAAAGECQWDLANQYRQRAREVRWAAMTKAELKQEWLDLAASVEKAEQAGEDRTAVRAREILMHEAYARYTAPAPRVPTEGDRLDYEDCLRKADEAHNRADYTDERGWRENAKRALDGTL